jgi:hypothetical protein
MSELTMTKPQREAFLADLHGGVVTISRDGEAPLAAPVWYSYEPGGDVVFVFESASEKIELVKATGRASLCVQNKTMPYKYACRRVTIVGGVDDDIERGLAHRYLGTEIGDIYLGVRRQRTTASAPHAHAVRRRPRPVRGSVLAPRRGHTAVQAASRSHTVAVVCGWTWTRRLPIRRRTTSRAGCRIPMRCTIFAEAMRFPARLLDIGWAGTSH